MKLNINIKVLLVLLTSTTLLSCTRMQEAKTGGSFSFSVPTASGRAVSVMEKSNSTLALNDLQVVIINVQTPFGPVVREIDFHDTAPPSGNAYTLTIDNIPKSSNMLAQVLAVYEGVGGTMVFKYGDKPIDTSGGGTIRTSITVANIGTSTKQVRVTGRYFDDPAYTGPTGTLVAFFEPAGGKPPMAVYKSDIINGWFSIFTLEGSASAFTFKLNETGETIFDDAYFDATADALKVGGSSITPGSHLMRIAKPAVYRQDYGALELNGEEDIFIGFFSDPSLSLSMAGYEACFPNLGQSISKAYIDSTLLSPLIWNPGSGTTSELRRIASSGLTKNFEELYGGTGTPCNPSTGIIFSPHRSTGGGSSDASIAGFNGPFKVMAPFESWGGYLTGSHSAGTITLNWDYLPGVAATGIVDGVTIYAKYDPSSSGGGGGGHNEKACDKYAVQNLYEPVEDVISSTETVSFNSSLTYQGNSLNSGNYYYWKFIACPFKMSGGAKKYYTTIAQSSSLSGGGNDIHYGWGATSSSISTTTNFSSLGATGRVTAISTANPSYTEISVPAFTSHIGKEIIFHISGEGTDGCGSSYQPNQYAFTRILYADATTVRIPKGTFLDGITTTNLSAAALTGNFCYVNAATVLQYINLDLTSTGALGAPQFNYDSAGGGILALRVSGTLTIASGTSIHASFMGYPASTSGAGSGGFSSSSMSGGSQHSLASGGGGGYGSGGSAQSATVNGGSGTTSGYGTYNMFMGGSGGGSITANGGSGGGIIFITANKIDAIAGSKIISDGQQGQSGSGAPGGGGAGSINIITNQASGELLVQAMGGSGYAGSPGGGGGGGGLAKLYICSNVMTTLSSNITGGSLGGSGATAGADGLFVVPTDPNELHFCGY